MKLPLSSEYVVPMGLPSDSGLPVSRASWQVFGPGTDRIWLLAEG
jgi:hypothetical protein